MSFTHFARPRPRQFHADLHQVFGALLSDTVAANKVIRTEPGVLTAVDKGSKVRLVVSSGSQPVTVPAVEWQGRPWTYTQQLLKDPRASVVAEAALLGPRWAAVEAFGAANPVDEITVGPEQAWLGIVSTGTAYARR